VAATSLGTLSTTRDELLEPGKGVLVLDRHAEAAAVGRVPRDEVAPFLALALSAPGLAECVSAVLLTRSALASTAELRSSAPTEPMVGVCLEPEALAGDQLERLRAAGARLVELRANLGPDTTPRGHPATEASALADGARLVQEAGLLPILTFAMPDLATHTANVSYAVTANALRALADACRERGVVAPELVIRTNMITAGSRAPHHAGADAVGPATVRVLRDSLPDDLGGVLLLSGGSRLGPACANLAAVASTLAAEPTPWPVSYAFARPLVDSAARAWDGSSDDPGVGRAIVAACRLASRALAPGRPGERGRRRRT
jgi:fructose-bisphosphate aldolase class I